jgi:hypothetical protein
MTLVAVTDMGGSPVAVGPGRGVAVATAVGPVVAVGTGAEAQLGPVIVFDNIVTGPPIARALPSKLTPVPKTMPEPAMIVPTNEPPERVAFVGTYQNTSQARAPFVKDTEPEVLRLLVALKIYTPLPAKVSPPLNSPAPLS